jgi:acetyltransferase-like isoleucine patch superfamily enzyme
MSAIKYIAFLRVFIYKCISGGYRCLNGAFLLSQPLLVKGNGQISAGKKVQIGVEDSPAFWSTYTYMEVRGKESRIEIDDGVILNNNATLTADRARIRIGSRTVAGINFLVMTSDGHNLDPLKRNQGLYPCLSVEIGEDVFIGDNVTILKGVHIGKGSTIGAGSVVTHNIPEFSVAAGNPCRVLRNL